MGENRKTYMLECVVGGVGDGEDHSHCDDGALYKQHLQCSGTCDGLLLVPAALLDRESHSQRPQLTRGQACPLVVLSS